MCKDKGQLMLNKTEKEYRLQKEGATKSNNF